MSISLELPDTHLSTERFSLLLSGDDIIKPLKKCKIQVRISYLAFVTIYLAKMNIE